jgi:hypothetical protein
MRITYVSQAHSFTRTRVTKRQQQSIQAAGSIVITKAKIMSLCVIKLGAFHVETWSRSSVVHAAALLALANNRHRRINLGLVLFPCSPDWGAIKPFQFEDGAWYVYGRIRGPLLYYQCAPFAILEPKNRKTEAKSSYFPS